MFNLDEFPRGASVPTVEQGDLNAVLKLMKDSLQRDEQEGRQRAVGMTFYKSACSPGADVMAVWFRAARLCLALKHGEFAEFMHKGEFKDSFLRLWATFPFKAVDIQPDGTFHLNRDDFDQALRKLKSE